MLSVESMVSTPPRKANLTLALVCLAVFVGAAASFVPGVPEVVLEPEVVLFGLLPPLLFAAAIQTSIVDVRARRDGILLLSVGLVAFTVIVVGFATYLVVPAITLAAAFAFGAVGMAATTFMRSWQDFDLIQLVVLPLFLFSGTFYPITSYPPALQLFVSLTPLYQGVALCRALVTGAVDPSILFHVAYLAVMGLIGLAIVSRRLDKLLLK